MSHSFGLEALVLEEDIGPASLSWYIEDSLSESLLADAVFCREAHLRTLQKKQIFDLNQQVSAFRLARESREASLTMGRRFAALAAALHPIPDLTGLANQDELHHSVAFGCVFGTLEIDAETTVGAFLQQCVVNIISSAQRLIPLGQMQASRIAWDLKPTILDAAKRTRDISFSAVCSFAHLPEVASMRHPCLPTRLFIS